MNAELQHVKDVEAFFRGKLADVDEPTLPFGLLELQSIDQPTYEAHGSVDAELAQRIHLVATRLGVDAATLFHTSWGLVVAKTSTRDDIVFGTVLLSSALPLRLKLRDVTAESLVVQTRQELLGLSAHQEASLSMARRCSGVTGAGPLFGAVLHYGRHTLGMGFPFALSVDDQESGFALTAYTDGRIEPRRVVDFVQQALRSLVEALEHAPQSAALTLSILPEQERRQIVELFNATQTPYPREKLVHQLFEEQVERTPQAVALLYEEQPLTYLELNQKANQLAAYLRDRGIGPDQLVGICVERSLEMVIGLLGILKAGGAYVPIDPGYPAERVEYMISDAAPKVLLTQQHLRARLPSTQAEIIALDDDWSVIARQPCDGLDTRAIGVGSHHLAYVIYTSGSTGQPKGAMNEHRGVTNRLLWMQGCYGLGPDDRVLQKTPFSFDVSVWEFFWTLMTGARLVIARPEGHKDPAYLHQLIESSGVTTLHFVPSMLQSFLDHHPPGSCPSLRHVVCSGEELSAALQRQCFECLPQVRLSNLYGPTEAAVDVTAWECDPRDPGSRVPIGRPISNIRMYVLGPGGDPVPLGVMGDIYIGGIGVGRGYLNRAELTAERFVKDPFSADPQGRMYRTGDLGRWRADGSLEYLGRSDHQVKIRGFRIELGEIEAQLTRHPQIKEAIVMAREGLAREKQLVAYVVPKRAEGEFQSNDRQLILDLRTHLKETLPDYMIPLRWVLLDQMPLSQNGKVARSALPEPEAGAVVVGEYVPPRTRLEGVLADIWKEVLRVDRVGIQDSFFDLGGTSLHAMKMVTMIVRQLSAELSVIDVLQFPTIEKLAPLVTAAITAADEVEYEEGAI